MAPTTIAAIATLATAIGAQITAAQDLPSTQYARVGAASVVVDNKWLLIGGVPAVGSGSTYTRALQYIRSNITSFDFSTKEVTSIRSAASSSSDATNRLRVVGQTCEYDQSGEKVYCFGGQPVGSQEFASGIATYTPKSNTWANTDTEIEGRSNHSSVTIGDVFYIFGGKASSVHLADLYKVSFSNLQVERQFTNSWPDGRIEHCAAALNDTAFIVIGGVGNDNKIFNDAWVYDTNVNDWTEVTSSIRGVDLARRGRSCVKVGSNIALFGGVDSKGEEHGDIYLLSNTTFRVTSSANTSPSRRSTRPARLKRNALHRRQSSTAAPGNRVGAQIANIADKFVGIAGGRGASNSVLNFFNSATSGGNGWAPSTSSLGNLLQAANAAPPASSSAAPARTTSSSSPAAAAAPSSTRLVATSSATPDITRSATSTAASSVRPSSAIPSTLAAESSPTPPVASSTTVAAPTSVAPVVVIPSTVAAESSTTPPVASSTTLAAPTSVAPAAVIPSTVAAESSPTPPVASSTTPAATTSVPPAAVIPSTLAAESSPTPLVASSTTRAAASSVAPAPAAESFPPPADSSPTAAAQTGSDPTDTGIVPVPIPVVGGNGGSSDPSMVTSASTVSVQTQNTEDPRAIRADYQSKALGALLFSILGGSALCCLLGACAVRRRELKRRSTGYYNSSDKDGHHQHRGHGHSGYRDTSSSQMIQRSAAVNDTPSSGATTAAAAGGAASGAALAHHQNQHHHGNKNNDLTSQFENKVAQAKTHSAGGGPSTTGAAAAGAGAAAASSHRKDHSFDQNKDLIGEFENRVVPQAKGLHQKTDHPVAGSTSSRTSAPGSVRNQPATPHRSDSRRRAHSPLTGAALSSAFASHPGGAENTGAADSPVPASPASTHKRYKVLWSSTPSQPDEIEASPGDIVEEKRIFADGWAMVSNLKRGKVGMIPLNILEEIKEGH